MVSTSHLIPQKIRRYVLVIVLLLLAGQLLGPPSTVLAAGPPPQEAPTALEPVTLQLKWYHQFQFAGYYAAQSQGYDRDAGLEVILPDLVELGHMNPGRWQRIAETYAALDMARPGYTLDGFIYNPQPEPDNTRFYVILAIIGVLLLLAGLAALILWIFNRQLRAAVVQRTRELKQSRAALQQSEERYRAVWEIAADAMSLSDPDGIVIDANPAYLALYGYSAPEVIGRSFAIIFPEERRDWAVEQYKASFANPQVPPVFETQIRRSDGTERVVETRIGFVESSDQRRLMLSLVRDITNRKQAEAALAESEERFRLIVENTHEGFWLREFPEDQITYVSPGLERVYGYPAATIMDQEARLIEEAVLPEYRPQVRAARRRIRTQGVPLNVTFQARREDGELAWIWIRSYPIYDAQGELSRIVGIAEDVTERKQMEAAIRESEELHRVTMENIVDPVFIADDAGKFTFICPNIPHNLGYSMEELAAMENISALVGENFFDPETLAATGYLPNIERVIVDKAGRPRTFLVSVKRVSIGEGTVLYTCRDITEFKQAEQALADSEEKHRLLFENAGVGIGYYTPEGGIIAFNKLACEHLAGQPEDFVGKHVLDVFGEAGAVYLERIVQAVNSEVVQTYEDCVRLPAGEHWFSSQFTRITDAADQVTGVQIIAHDITERKETEQALRRYERIVWATPDYVSMIDRDYIYRIVNKSYVERAGKNYHKMVDHSVAELMGEEVFQTIVKPELDRCLAGETIRYQHWFDFPGEERGYMDVTYFPFRDEDGTISGVVVSNRDITELKLARTALQESEKNLRAVIDATDESVLLIEPNGTVIECNEGIARRFGRTRDALLGTNSYDLVDEAVAANRRQYAGQVVASGQPARFVDKRFGRTIDNSVYPVLDEAGQVVRLAVFGHDITEQVQAEAARRESEAKNKALLEAIPDLMFRLTHDGRVIDFRASRTKDLVLEPEQVLGSQLCDTMPPEVCDLIEERVARLLETGQMQIFEYQLPVQRGLQDFEARLVVSGKDDVLAIVRNITERKAAEEALRRYQHIVSATSDAVSLVDLNYVFQVINSAYVKRTLKSYDQIIGHSVTKVFGEKVFQELIKPHLDSCFSGEVVRYQAWFEYAGIGRRFMDVTYSPYRGGSDAVTGAVVNARDITDLRLAQQSLQESEANLRALIENTDGIIWAIDHDYRLIAANSTYYDNMRAAFGRKLQPGDPLMTDDFPADAVAQWRAYYNRALRGERFSVEHETRYLASIQYFEYWFSPIQTTGGRVIGATIYGRDITARKQAEAALQASEKRYRHLFENAQDAIMITDDEQRFVEINPAACAMLGYSREELLALGVADVVPEAMRSRVRQQGQEFRRVGQMAGEFTLLRKDGSQIETEYRSVANFLSGLNMVFFRDITERKIYERNLKATLAEKETLLQELYHRTKNNMQVISSMLMLQMVYTEDKLVKRIFEETNNKIRAMAMVHEKLYQSQNLSSIDLAEYITDLVALLVRSYGEQAYGIVILRDLASVPVLIDTAIPCGLLLNELISNVFKHAFPKGRSGTLNIRLRKLADQTIVLGVSDDGVGFPPDFDVSNDGRLGLTLISTLAERQLNGEMTFRGDNGVTFEVRFRDTQYKARV